LAALEADREKFAAIGAQILAINPASVKAHDSYCSKKGFGFPLLSDPDKSVTREYGALMPGGTRVQRSVYVVGPDRKIIFGEKGMPADQLMLDAIANSE